MVPSTTMMNTLAQSTAKTSQGDLLADVCGVFGLTCRAMVADFLSRERSDYIVIRT
jgi:hypothetical protein